MGLKGYTPIELENKLALSFNCLKKNQINYYTIK